MKKLLIILCSTISVLASSLDALKTSFTASFNTIDNTTNIVTTISVPSNRVIRVEARFLGVGDSYHSCSYTKIGTFRNINGTNTIQIGITAVVGSAETDNAFESLIRTDGTNVILSVAGAVEVPLQWLTYVDVFYSPEFNP